VTARKLGNVHHHLDFDDCPYLEFLLSAAAIAPVMEAVWHRPVAETIRAAVLATRQVVPSNTNLGIILLHAPPGPSPTRRFT
jgi:triphosphoribosyl-dephospho-CoA synthase